MKAIETKYNGFRFRSRLEARWAVFFDHLEVRYDYEKEGFDLEDAGYYLPDFWLPERGFYFEVKGEHPSSEEQYKMGMLAGMSGHLVYCQVGQIDKDTTGCVFVPLVSDERPYACLFPAYFTTCPLCSKLALQIADRDMETGTLVYCYNCYDVLTEKRIEVAIPDTSIREAYIAAREAQFEHKGKR